MRPWACGCQHGSTHGRHQGRGVGAGRQPGQARSPTAGAEGTGAGGEGRSRPLTNAAPHLVDELPDVLLPQVVHHVLGREEAVRPSPAPHTPVSQKETLFPLQTPFPAVPGWRPWAGWGRRGPGSLRSHSGELDGDLPPTFSASVPALLGWARPGCQDRLCRLGKRDRARTPAWNISRHLSQPHHPREHKHHGAGPSCPRLHHRGAQPRWLRCARRWVWAITVTVPPPAVILLLSSELLHPPRTTPRGVRQQRLLGRAPPGQGHWTCGAHRPAVTWSCLHRTASYLPLGVGRCQQQRNEQGHRLQLQLGVRPAGQEDGDEESHQPRGWSHPPRGGKAQGEQRAPVWQEPWARASPFSGKRNLQTEEMRRHEEDDGTKNLP